jgi:hypothetical protein
MFSGARRKNVPLGKTTPGESSIFSISKIKHTAVQQTYTTVRSSETVRRRIK